MDLNWREVIWHQFGAAINTLQDAIRACPDELWRAHLWQEQDLPDFAAFWYISYHTLFWLDFYCAETYEEFTPPAPFTISEQDADGVLPDRVYSKDELLRYLEYGRAKCRARIASAPDLLALQQVRTDWADMTVAGLMMYTMRHVQEHAAELSMFLGNNNVSTPGWVSRDTHALANAGNEIA